MTAKLFKQNKKKTLLLMSSLTSKQNLHIIDGDYLFTSTLNKIFRFKSY